jgi:hypothetical protein
VVALGDNSPQVEMATPGVGDGAIERFTARFNQPMVPLGDPRAAGPFDVECPVGGEGRWVDQQTFVHEFASPLPGGVTCTFTLKDKLKSLAGYAVTGQTKFTVDSGGPDRPRRAAEPLRQRDRGGPGLPRRRQSRPRSRLGRRQRLLRGRRHRREDPGRRAARRRAGQAAAGLGTDRWEVQSFLEEAGLPQALPAAAADRAKATASVVALKCRRPLPPAATWRWSGARTSPAPAGRIAGTDQRFDFTVRKPFTARFECSRVNPQAGCSPVQDAWVRFSAPIPRAGQGDPHQAARRQGTGADLSDEGKTQGSDRRPEVQGAAPAAVTAKLSLPADVTDESGRKLSNAERFPLDVRFDEAPPLVKFAADFGILEAKEGGVLPVTVRNVEPKLVGSQMAVERTEPRVEGGDGEIAKWLRAIDDAAETKTDVVKHGEETIRINQTGAKPLLTPATGKPFQVACPAAARNSKSSASR